MSNQQFDEVEELARQRNINLGICPTCGSKREEVEPNSGIYVWPDSTYKLDGESFPCKCEEQINLQRHYLLANLPKDYWTLSAADFFGDKDALAQAMSYLEKWDNMSRHGIGIQFYSPTMGTGKTMLATLIGKDLVQRGESVYFIPFRDTVRVYEMPYEERKEMVTRLRQTPVLVLDEVGLTLSDAQRAFFATELEDLIRFRTSGNSVTIVTTNLTPKELDEQYPRTFSLLAATTQLVSVSGEDVRRAGEIDFLNMELALNGEAKPIS
jgi:DNA replication protein DnaC